MSADTVVHVRHLSKQFRRGERHDSLRDLLPSIARTVTGRRRPARASGEFWAVNDVSFDVARGEALGIIGPNGAGKSTMLKLLTKILRPTSGVCEVRGRAGALIEIAAGFHPDLTGRENVFLQGAIMGMPRREIARVMDRIVDFAGVEDFIDTPVKRFSSGMNARLGFSIAAHLDPEVLIIDEVLAVGDVAFQEKCIRRMHEFKRNGVAIVFVSHNMQAVSQLCDRALFLKSSVLVDGPPSEAIARYLSTTEARQDATGGPIDIRNARLTDEEGAPVTSVAPGTPLRLEVDYVPHEPLPGLAFGFVVVRSTDGVKVYSGRVTARELGLDPFVPDRGFTLQFGFRPHLTRGQYHVICHVYDDRTASHPALLSPAAVFGVAETRTYEGIADVELECEVARMAPAGSEPARREAQPA